MAKRIERAPARLSELGLTASRCEDAVITGLSVDSRNVKPGNLFAALPGSAAHGADFIKYALRMDAAAVLTDPKGAEIAADEIAEADVSVVITEDPRQALAYASKLWFGAQPGSMVAVTGTNGKTSVANFTRQIWMEMGLAGVNLGTTGVEGTSCGN